MKDAPAVCSRNPSDNAIIRHQRFRISDKFVIFAGKKVLTVLFVNGISIYNIKLCK